MSAKALSFSSKPTLEHLVDEVEVVVQTLAGVASQKRVARGLVVPWLVRRAGLHGREDVHQPWMISAFREDLLDAILLAEGLHLPDVLDGDALFGRDLLGVSADGIAERLNELRVVEQPNAPAVEHRGHRLRVADARDRSLDDYAVQTRKHASDVVPMAFDQVRHRLTISPITASHLPLWFEATPG